MSGEEIVLYNLDLKISETLTTADCNYCILTEELNINYQLAGIA